MYIIVRYTQNIIPLLRAGPAELRALLRGECQINDFYSNVNKTPLRKNLLIWQSGLKHNSALIFLVLFSSKEKST